MAQLRLGGKRPIDIMDFIEFMQRYGVKMEDTTRAGIVGAVASYINQDTGFIGQVRNLLLSRMKYATGNLLHSIRLRASAGRVSKSDESADNINAPISDNVRYVTVQLVLDTSDETLINALYGEKDLQKLVDSGREMKIPTKTSIMAWINAKRQMFNKQIDILQQQRYARAAARRTKDAKRREIQRRRAFYRTTVQTLRSEFYGMTPESAPIHMRDKEPGEEMRHVVGDLADRIRTAMSFRVASGKAPIRGSEYVFLGNRPKYEGDKAKYSFTPRYRKLDTPLLHYGYKKHDKGEINKLIDDLVQTYINKVVNEFKRGVFRRLRYRELRRSGLDNADARKEVIKQYGRGKYIDLSDSDIELDKQILRISNGVSVGGVLHELTENINVLLDDISDASRSATRGNISERAGSEGFGSAKEYYLAKRDIIHGSIEHAAKAVYDNKDTHIKATQKEIKKIKNMVIRRFDKVPRKGGR